MAPSLQFHFRGKSRRANSDKEQEGGREETSNERGPTARDEAAMTRSCSALGCSARDNGRSRERGISFHQ